MPVSLRVGRGADNDLILPDDSVSQNHAVLREQQGVYFISDLGSTNGTFVNRNKISMSQVQAGDVVHFGLVRKYFDGRSFNDNPPMTEASESDSLTSTPRHSSKRTFTVLVALAIFAGIGVFVWATSGNSAMSVDEISRATVQVFISDSSGEWCYAGSGFFALDTGLVVTNAHVVTDDECGVLSVGLVDETGDRIITEIPATLIMKDDELDLAVLKVDSSQIDGYPRLEIADTPAKRGDEVRVFGFPGIGGPTITATAGIISGIDEETDYPYYKTSADINPGNSGGPAVDAKGRVIGVATAGYRQEIECEEDDSNVCFTSGSSLGLLRPISLLKELYP